MVYRNIVSVSRLHILLPMYKTTIEGPRDLYNGRRKYTNNNRGRDSTVVSALVCNTQVIAYRSIITRCPRRAVSK